MIRMTIASVQRLKPVTSPIAVDVAPEHVGAEPILRRGPAQPADRGQCLRIDRAEIRGEERHQHHQAKQARADHDRWMTADIGLHATLA